MQSSEPHIPNPLTVGVVASIGAGLAFGITLLVVALELEFTPSLLLASTVYFVAAWLAARRTPRAPFSTLIALIAPLAALYGFLALNAESWTLLGVPGSALLAAGIGTWAGYRSPGRSASGAGYVE